MKENLKERVQRTLDLMKYHIKIVEKLMEDLPDDIEGEVTVTSNAAKTIPDVIMAIKKSTQDRYINDMMDSFLSGFKKYGSLTVKQLQVLNNFAAKFNIQRED